MGVRAESGGAAVIASGMITSFFGSPILLFLDDWSFALGFRFERDDGEVRVETELFERRLEMTLFNFEDGRGSAEPVPLVPRDGYGLWVHFRVFRHGNTVDHTLHYTVFANRLEDRADQTPPAR